MNLIQQFKPSKPTNKLEWILLFSELIFVTSYFINNILLDLPYIRSVNFKPIEFSSYSTMCFCLIFGSISNSSSWQVHSKRLFSFICGVILILSPLIMSIYLFFSIPHTLNSTSLTPETIAKLEQLLQDKKLDNERKNFISIMIAEEKFEQNGQRIQIFDKNGNPTMHVPTERTLEIYNSKQRLLAVIPKLKIKIYALTSLLLFSISFGIIQRKFCLKSLPYESKDLS